jgi:cellulose synthase/poly-beta-1,6-N-acetylglucosamine synthase-like glycosyltransferase
MVHNEAANIGRLLQTLLTQETRIAAIDEIVVVSSGCVDDTDAIVRRYAALDPRVRLIQQEKRSGKASAVNLFLKNVHSDVIILESADTLPGEGSIDALVRPFANPRVGMVGGRPVPVNRGDTFMGFGVQLLWELHHKISLRRPKMGELIAFRQIFAQIPHNTAVDEASIEPLIIGQGFDCVYAPGALVYNKGPETVREYLQQRRRIFAGHLYVRDMLGYRVSTMNAARIALLFLQSLKSHRRQAFWALGIALLEIIARLLAVYDYSVRRINPFQWAIIQSTKNLI